MIKKILLFGSGAYGLKLLTYFGKNNIYAFCDNGCHRRGYKYGVLYIPVEEFLEIYREHLVVLSVNRGNAHEIALQLWNKGITDFLICNEDMMNEMLVYNPDEYLEILNNETERARRERDQYIEFNRRLEEQLEELKDLSNIRLLGKARGYLSYVQSETINFTAEVFGFFFKNKFGDNSFCSCRHCYWFVSTSWIYPLG